MAIRCEAACKVSDSANACVVQQKLTDTGAEIRCDHEPLLAFEGCAVIDGLRWRVRGDSDHAAWALVRNDDTPGATGGA